MVKPLLLLAFVGHIFVLVSSTSNCRNCRRNSRSPTRSKHFPCSKNEIWVPCPEAVCAPKTCDDVGFPIPCIDLHPNGTCPSRPSCICKEGFLRNDRGNCIPKEFCRRSACKKRHEVYDPCPSFCPHRTCGINDAAVSCARALPNGHPNCPPPTCRCRDGYYRNHLGNCVRWEKCPICKRPNEIYDPCPAPCPPKTCDVNEALILCQVPPQLGDPECKPGCRCRDGFVKNQARICIPKDKCPKCTKPNQVYDPCIAPCPPRRCGVDKRLIKCAPPPKVGDPLCKAGCRCADGYVTNSEGVCIPEEKCPPQCPLNEVYSNCIQGNCTPQKCYQLGFPVPCPRIDPRFCRKGCLCKNGYVRNNKGVCIPTCECPSCGGDPNAENTECGGNCNRHCSDIGKKPGPCTLICKLNGCSCKKGFYYDDITKKCVKPEKCTSCGGDPNAEHTQCGGNCNRHCSDIGKKPGACILSCELNGCSCKKGFYYDDKTKKCVKPEQCPRTCPLNEIYSNCINGGCQARNCSQYGKPVPCIKIDPKYCKKGCICKDKYLRARNGQCVPEEHCPEACNGPNKEYSECSWDCPPQTCESLDRVYVCPIREGDKCKPMCRCKPGYFKNKINQCITEHECRKCMGPHEYYSCGGACDNVCNTLHKQSQKNCPIINITCNKKCYCEEGYARDKNNTCIPISCCDNVDTHICGKNEVFENCRNPICRAKSCTQVGFPLDCKHACVKGCICQNGYVRDKNGRCIPINQCPSCGGDPNAKSGCGTNCGKRCPNNYVNPKFCPRIACVPQLNRCECKDGFYYDIYTKRCVKLENCSPRCNDSNNEVFDSCVNGGCGWKNCSEVGGPILCIDPIKCAKGCKCKDGYYRLDNGNCVPKEMCPVKCKGPNEYFSCGPECDNVCDKLDTESKDNCPRKNIRCVSKCYCKDGFARNKRGICIPINQCPGCETSSSESGY